MSNQIRLLDAYNNVFYVVYDDQITLQYNGTTASYTPPGTTAMAVALVEANFDDDVFTVTLANSSAYPVNEIRVRVPGSATEVETFMQWTISSTNLVLGLEIPAGAGQVVTWEFGASAPPIKLKVKLKRNA